MLVPTHLTDISQTDTKSTEARASRASRRRVSALSHAQLVRKRAHDREAQRAARERTKRYVETLENRIQHLLEICSSHDESKSDLAREREKTRALTEELALLKSKITTANDVFNPVSEDSVRIQALSRPVPNIPEDNVTSEYTSSTFFCPPDFGSVSTSIPVEAGPKYHDASIETFYQTPSLNPGILATQSASIPPFMMGGTWTESTSFVNQPSSDFNALPELLTPPEKETGMPNDTKTGMEWQLVNNVFMTSDHIVRYLPSTVQDEIPWHSMLVRAVTDGWDSIDHIVGHIPLWQNLRLVDQIICVGFADVERLSAIYIMYVRLNYLSNPTPENKAMVPKWYQHSVSETENALQSAYFLVWPGLRERLKDSPHRFSNNDFWLLFKKTFQIIWPYEFRDCYRRNSVANTFDISPTFELHVLNIKCWGAHKELYMQYPELRGDMACVGEIPASLAGSSVAQFKFARPMNPKHAEVSKKKNRRFKEKPNNNAVMRVGSTSRKFDQATKATNAPEFGDIIPHLVPDPIYVSPEQPNFLVQRRGPASDSRFTNLDD